MLMWLCFVPCVLCTNALYKCMLWPYVCSAEINYARHRHTWKVCWSVAQSNWDVQDQVVILTNQCIMKLRAPGFAQVHRAAKSGVSLTNLMEVPPTEVRWAIPWQVSLSVRTALQGPH